MRSERLLDPELKPFLKTLPQMALSNGTLLQARAGLKATLAQAPAPSTQTAVESHDVPGPGPAPPVRVVSYRPDGISAALPGLLHFHGGGFVLGMPEMMDVANRRLASELGCMVFSVDYRLAPETRFPGQLEDGYVALLWLHANAGPLGVDAARIGVKGESAGGGLAASLALLARDRSGPPLLFQHLIFPMLDDRTCMASDPNPFTGEFAWTAVQNRFGWTSLLDEEPGSPNVSAYAAVARADDLTGLPPAFIGVGSLDLFLEEDLAYARNLSRAGVPVKLHVYPGAFHRFYEAPEARVAQAAQRDSRDAPRRAMETLISFGGQGFEA